MKRFFFPLVALAYTASAFAGTETDNKAAVTTAAAQTETVPLNIFKLESSYDFESDLNHGGSFGKQDLIENE